MGMRTSSVRKCYFLHIRWYFLFAASLLLKESFTQMTLEVTVTAAGFDADKDSLFIAGTFNNWEPADPKYRLTKVDAHTFTIVLQEDIGKYFSFKCTKGDWMRGEVEQDGRFRSDHTYFYKPGAVIHITVPAFADVVQYPVQKNDKVITHTLFSPELNRDVTIRVYLPCNYQDNDKQYPVLYLFDGQNLFDNQSSPFGEWRVDEAVDSICKAGGSNAIIVGIDHGGDKRLAEYSPWPITDYAMGGNGDATAQFVMHTVKPFIDTTYHTLPDRANTAVGGSSLGGLMAYYMVLQYNTVFSKGLIFSPSLWINDEVDYLAARCNIQLDTRMYFYSGGMEDEEEQVREMWESYSMLSNMHFPDLHLFFALDEDATHTENAWADAFPEGFVWLFGE